MKKLILLFSLIGFYTNFLNAQQTVGLFQNDPGSFNGYTLFSPNGDTTTYLIDNCGNKVHTWHSQYKAGLYAYIQPDGRLLRGGVSPLPGSDFQAGGRAGIIQILDWNSNVLWEYETYTSSTIQHHDCRMLPNGNILSLQWQKYDSLTAILNGRNPSLIPDGEIWSDRIVEYQPIGTDSAIIVWSWDFWDHMIQDFDSSKLNYGVVADHPELINLNFVGFQPTGIHDWLHCNAISYNDSLDQIVISARHTSEIYIIDHSTTTIESASHSGGNMGKGGDLLYRWGNPAAYDRGTSADQQLFTQHDSYWIPNDLTDGGKIMIFNNGPRPSENFSSVDIINPPRDGMGNYIINSGQPFGPLAPDWQYTSPVKEDFYGQYISGAQRLPNGNTLICNGPEGNIFEIDNANNIVWNYINPVLTNGIILSQGDTLSTTTVPGLSGKNNIVFRAYRYGPDYAGLNGQTLTPTVPVELNPTPSSCTITSINNLTPIYTAAIYPNPANDFILIDINEPINTNYKIYDIAGKIVSSGVLNSGKNSINTSDMTNGVYFIQIDNYPVEKFIINY